MRTHTLAVLAVALAQHAAGAIIRVPADTPSIQSAINIASPGDEIVIAPGTYFESINPLGKQITIRSTDPDDSSVVESTIIDGMMKHVVIVCESGETNKTVFDGLRIQHGSSGSGGGMRNVGSSPTVRRCIFHANVSSSGGFGGRGGGMLNMDGSSPHVTGCTFRHNTGGSTGGGMLCLDDSNATIENCVFHSNGSGFGTAGLDIRNSTATIVGCTFYDNIGGGRGGAIGLGGSNSFIIGCTMTRNHAGLGGGGVAATGASFPWIANCIIWSNSGGQVLNHTSSFATVVFSIIENGFPGLGNISGDPMFADPDNNDFRVAPGSPAIDAGDNNAVPPGTTTDGAGAPRFADDPCSPNSGNGDGAIVDIGANEFQGTTDVCSGDCDNNGTVDFGDLVAILFAFGPSDECLCDTDNSGTINFADLVGALFLFGPCPN